MDKNKNIIWKNRGERKDVKEDDNMQFLQNNAANSAIMMLVEN